MTDLPRTTDAEAFVREHATWLVRLAYLLTSSREDALDLAQETCERIWRSWESVVAADDSRAYAATIMTNLQRSRWRRKRPFEIPYEDARHDAPARTMGFDEVDAIRQGLDRLSDRQRKAIVLRYWLDLDDVTIAEALGCRPATVRSLLARGIARLRDVLDDDSYDGRPS
ncbi:sigma-70 family RNA polymerase sigma factor [Mumia zhuanghuii]|uniref:Sigma-70 family RNA polymerase sigma factor n=2 Tax=Mumia TaxID=1546255 RepID=A0ABW1QGQ7_9ACTN|nr:MULTISPECIES: sigma-70 family RNA polymerase sigma factor [Mumia]KAA1422927.1 sigma-70 family RNA polymerase sigma factor [Mumia zhuanghuii]